MPRTDEIAVKTAENQLAHFKTMISAGYGLPTSDNIMDHGIYVYDDDLSTGLKVKRTHSSKSIPLPIVGACSMRNPDNLTINNLSYNFHFYFMDVALKQPVPASLLWPISGLFGSIPLSGHVQERNCITNFEKSYHNIERIDKISMQFGHPLQGVLAIRYLREISKLSTDDILNAVFYKTQRGLVDCVDFNNIDSGKLVEFCGLKTKSNTYDYDVEDLDKFFRKMNIDIWDLNNGSSSVHFTTTDFLPPLTTPSRTLLVKASLALREAGIGESDSKFRKDDPYSIPVHLLKAPYNQEASQARYPLRLKLNGAYHRIPLDTREFSVNTPNGLDSMLTAMLLQKCLPPAMEGMKEWMAR